MDSLIVQLFRLSDEVPVPAYGTSMSACFDLSFQPTGRFSLQGYDQWNNPVDRMCYVGNVIILPGDRILLPTGLVMKIKNSGMGSPCDTISNYSIRLHARSGMSLKQGLVLANAEGVIDVDYQKEIFVMLTNISVMPITVHTGDRIAQAEIVRNYIAYFELVNEQPKPHSERDGGFGSTGHA
jgi:dUTP pyrophosphatase